MYCIKDNYKHRTNENYFDDTNSTDEWQKEVYQYARKIVDDNQYHTVLDFGCGSGFKLINNFKEYNTIGIDVPQTVQHLKNVYPGRTWLSSLDAQNDIDVFIASDVIEHMLNPDILIEYIKKCSPKDIILSTPDRDLVVKYLDGSNDGPPQNDCHVREWNSREFIKYISKHFHVLNHTITNEQQATQLIHCRMR